MSVLLVTGYVPIPDHPRTRKDYDKLFFELSEVRVPRVVYENSVESCWLYGPSKKAIKHSVCDNPRKNTRAYHIVQHQKTAWLAEASVTSRADVLVWVDYGIFSQSGHSRESIESFFERLQKGDLALPGCWGRGPVLLDRPCWRFCGSVLVCPRDLAMDLHCGVMKKVQETIDETGVLEWEVNTWARLELEDRLPIRWYAADHNASMFDNYR